MASPLLTVLVVLGQAAASRPAPSELEAMSLEELLRTEVVAATKLPVTAKEAPAIASVVPASQVREYGWYNLNELLLSQPGFFQSQDYERPTVGVRGQFEPWNSNHLLLLVDGVPMNELEAGGLYGWDTGPLFFAKTVEVIRGPGSSLYGSNAMNGVIAIKTVSSATLVEGGKLHQNNRVVLRYGERGSTLVQAMAAAGNEVLSGVVSFQRFQTSGDRYLSLDDSGRVDANGNLARFPVQDGRSNHYLFAKVEGNRGALAGLSLQYHLQNTAMETGHGWSLWIPEVARPITSNVHALIARWASPNSGPFQHEYLFRYGHQATVGPVKMYPAGAFDGFYPNGVVENMDYSLSTLLARAQWSYAFLPELTLLGGLEGGTLLYGGDKHHDINVDINDDENGNPPVDPPMQLPGMLQPIQNLPAWNLGAFTQLSYNRIAGIPLSLTGGLRFDWRHLRYKDFTDPAEPILTRTFLQLSPRLALVYLPIPALSIKAQASQAFRAPTQGELFWSNSWTQTSDPRTRQERTTTFELGVDWSALKQLTVRMNGFATRANDLVGYQSTGLLTNLYSRDYAGLEAELLAEVPVGTFGQIATFANYTYVGQLREAITDPLLTPSNRLTWGPAHVAKAGVVLRHRKFEIALQGLFQGPVDRRDSDVLTVGALRAAAVAPWFRLDGNVRYHVLRELTIGIRATNLFNSRGNVIRGGDSTFDYQIEGRRIWGSLELAL